MAVGSDRATAIAAPYAEALFNLAQQAGKADEVLDELRQLVELVQSQPEARAVLTSPIVEGERRAEWLERALRGRISDLTLNTFQVLNRHGRFQMAEPLLRAYELYQQKAAGQVEATALSAVELDDDQKTKIAALAASISGLKPLVSFRVDPDLIGGLVLQIGDVRYDNTVRTQLQAAHEKLLLRSEHGLAVSVAV